MTTTLDLLNSIAQVVGGSRPAGNADPYFFSGAQAGDSTGVAGLKGCYSVPPEGVLDLPMAVVMPGPFKVENPKDLIIQGEELNVDEIPLWVLVGRTDSETGTGLLVPYRDSIQAVFRSHLQLLGSPNVLDAFVIQGHPGKLEWAGNEYLGWEFVIRVRRLFSPIYSA